MGSVLILPPLTAGLSARMTILQDISTLTIGMRKNPDNCNAGLFTVSCF